nr:hypothetical protein [Tanacetum cinerariifolium]
VPYGDIEETMAKAMLYPRLDGMLDGSMEECLNNLELALSLAKRGNLLGVENLCADDFSRYLMLYYIFLGHGG